MLLFHLFGGRFLPQVVRDAVYAVFCTYLGAGVFYTTLFAAAIFAAIRFRKQGRERAIRSTVFFWLLAALSFAAMLWLPTRLLILGDRYLYFILPPFCLLIAMLILRIRAKALRVLVTASILALQCAATLHLSMLWKKSDMLNRGIVRNFTVPDTGRIILLLNNPHSLCGAPMIGAGRDGELAADAPVIPGRFDLCEGVRSCCCRPGKSTGIPGFAWISDSTIIAGAITPWWRSSDYLHSYSTPDYELRIDSSNGYGYIVRLKGDVRRFVPMYIVGMHWYILAESLRKPPNHRKSLQFRTFCICYEEEEHAHPQNPACYS